MKISILILLLGLIACGGKKTPTVVATKTYGGHTLTIFSDGSKEWTYSSKYEPIVDMDAHIAKADATILNNYNYNRCSSDTCYEVSVEKYDTLLGNGWVIIKTSSFENNTGRAPKYDPYYTAYNLNYITEDWTYIRPPNDGDIGILDIRVEKVDEENNIFLIKDGTSIRGYYNKTSEFGEVGIYTLHGLDLAGKNLDFTILKQAYLDNWANFNSSTLTESDLGIDDITTDDFYFSEDIDSTKDLETIAATVEAQDLEQYGLSTKTAKMVKTLAKTAGKRALTAREKDMFAKELIGMSFDKAAEMMVEDYEGLIERAAELNETSPEVIKELINTIM